MPLAALLALSVLAADPASAPPPATPAPLAAQGLSRSTALAAPDQDSDDENDIPTNAPKDDYGFVAWCYGALDEYLDIYEVVKPDLKDIDKLFGSPVVEAQPYSQDIAEDRKALKRFGVALAVARRTSPPPVVEQAEEAIRSGHAMWSLAKAQPHRRLADAWLFWGLPPRCDRAAKRLRTHTAAPEDGAPAVAPQAPAPAADPPAAGQNP